MIHSRKNATPANGAYDISMTEEQIKLISALLCVTVLGHRPYQKAAMTLLTDIENLMQNEDYGLHALEDIMPVFEVRDGAFNLVDTFDHGEISIQV